MASGQVEELLSQLNCMKAEVLTEKPARPQPWPCGSMGRAHGLLLALLHSQGSMVMVSPHSMSPHPCMSLASPGRVLLTLL